jgi:hypothetical protein
MARRTPVKNGSRIRISNEGEGWFFEYEKRELSGTISSHFRGVPEPGYAGASMLTWYTVEFDEVIEIQERGGLTVSGLHLLRYSHAAVAPRWGDSLEANQPQSCFVKLLRQGVRLPRTSDELRDVPLRIWATCCAETSAPA